MWIVVSRVCAAEIIYHNQSQIKLSFNILANKTNAGTDVCVVNIDNKNFHYGLFINCECFVVLGCCREEHFDCMTCVNRRGNEKYTLNVKLLTFTQHDIIMLRNPTYDFSCRPSTFYESGTGSFTDDDDDCWRKTVRGCHLLE